MGIPDSEKARIVARGFGWGLYILNGIALLIATCIFLAPAGYQLFRLVMEEEEFYFLDWVPDFDLFELPVKDVEFYFGVDYRYILAIFGISSALQSYGARLLIQATKMHAKPNEAIGKVNTHQRIQFIHLCVEIVLIISSILLDLELAVESYLIFLIVSFLFRSISIHAVQWFQSQLQISMAAYGKMTETDKLSQHNLAEAVVFTIFVPE